MNRILDADINPAHVLPNTIFAGRDDTLVAAMRRICRLALPDPLFWVFELWDTRVLFLFYQNDAPMLFLEIQLNEDRTATIFPNTLGDSDEEWQNRLWNHNAIADAITDFVHRRITPLMGKVS